jgi:hypothetical protein
MEVEGIRDAGQISQSVHGRQLPVRIDHQVDLDRVCCAAVAPLPRFCRLRPWSPSYRERIRSRCNCYKLRAGR